MGGAAHPFFKGKALGTRLVHGLWYDYVQDIEMANMACQSKRKIITDYKVKVSDEKGHYDLAQ